MKKSVHKSRTVVVTTVVVLALLIAADIWLFLQMAAHTVPYALGAMLAVVITASIVGSYAYAPLSVELSDIALVLHRGVGRKVIRYADMSGIEFYKRNGTPLRVCGCGGVFGFIGRYRNSKTGISYFSYVGDYSQAFFVVLKNGRRYLLSCEDREAVVAAVKKKL